MGIISNPSTRKFTNMTLKNTSYITGLEFTFFSDSQAGKKKSIEILKNDMRTSFIIIFAVRLDQNPANNMP